MTNPTKSDFACAAALFPARNPAALPIHFRLGTRAVDGIPADFHPTSAYSYADANILRYEYTGISPDGLEVRLTETEYRDYPVREWTATFTNRGQTDTGILSDIRIGGTLSGSEPQFDHSNGDNCGEDGYTWFADLVTNETRTIFPDDGTSCHCAAPYMILRFREYGVRIGIGYPAMWQASVRQTEDGAEFLVGQRRCHMKLYPGETIRTPSVTMLCHTGDEAHGRNLWRRWYMTHILPREDGVPLSPYCCMHNFCAGGMPEFTGATEENQCGALRAYLRGGIHPDIWWIDAGWYPCGGNWPCIGTWEPDPVRFPHGLSPIGALCRENDVRFLLWFEPERVVTGTWLHEHHHDWLLPIPEPHADDPAHHSDNHLLDLGNPAALEWLIEHVDGLIKGSGVRVYRQDFNFAPLPCFVAAEAEDRIGAVENHHVQGYLRYWDELIRRNPGLWIDSCASGGRRNDLDTMRRAVPLHYTDVGYGNHPIKQKQHRTMFAWIPYFRAHNMSWDMPDGTYGGGDHPVPDEFAYENAMAPSLTDMLHYTAGEADYDRAKRMQALWRRAAHMELSCDYYPLTETDADAHDWYAMQFDGTAEGFVQVIRNTLVEDDTATFPMHVEDGATYTFTDENGDTFVKTAAQLAGGFTVSLPRRTGRIWFYTKG